MTGFSFTSADLVGVGRYSEEQLVSALERCVAECGHDAINQNRYMKWRSLLPDPAVVPNPLAFGNAREFVGFCEAHEIPCVEARRKSSSLR